MSARTWLSGLIEKGYLTHSYRKKVLLILCLALLARAAVLMAFWTAMPWQLGHIHDDWDKLAINWVETGTFGVHPGEATIQRAPAFPILEIPLYLIFGRNYAWWSISLLLFDIGTCLLIILLSRRLWGNAVSLLAGTWYALYMPLIYYTARIEQFTIGVPFVMLWFYLVTSWDQQRKIRFLYPALGLVTGILMLNKSVYLPITFCACILLIFKSNRKAMFSRIRGTLIVAMTAAAIIAPWSIRNFVVTQGKVIPVQSLFWEIIWQKLAMSELDKNEGMTRPDGRTMEYFLERQSELFSRRENSYIFELTGPRKELQEERVYKKQVIEWIRQRPARYLAAMGSNVWGFWFRAENLGKTRLMVIMQLPFLAGAIFGFAGLMRRRALASVQYGLLFVVLLWARSSMVLGWGRYSLDAAPVLSSLFGLGIVALVKKNRISVGPLSVRDGHEISQDGIGSSAIAPGRL